MRIIGWIATAVLVAGTTACGGSDEAAAPAAPMKVERAASTAVNHAPVIRSVRLNPASPIDGDRIHAIVAVADQDGDPIELGFEWQISGRPIPTGEASIELKGVTKRDRIEVAVKASDGKLQSDTARAEARVQNRRPTVVGIAIRPQPEVFAGETLVATAQANDPDGDSIGYSYKSRRSSSRAMEPRIATISRVSSCASAIPIPRSFRFPKATGRTRVSVTKSGRTIPITMGRCVTRSRRGRRECGSIPYSERSSGNRPPIRRAYTRSKSRFRTREARHRSRSSRSP